MVITIDSVKVKTGTSEKGPWVNTQIEDTNGTRWTSFLGGLQYLHQGDSIDIEDYTEGKDNKLNRINKFSLVKKQEEAVEPPPEALRGKMSSPEEGMWWKELGECLRSGYIKSVPLKNHYLKKMYEVVGFEVKPKEQEPPELGPEDIPF